MPTGTKTDESHGSSDECEAVGMEEKLTRIDDAGVELQQMKMTLVTQLEGLEEDKKLLTDPDENCEGERELPNAGVDCVD